MRRKADFIIDTSNLQPKQLKEILVKRYAITDSKKSMTVTVVSFGFKHGMPIDADIVEDVRFLPNPYYIDDFRHKSGRVPCVRDYVESFPITQVYKEKWFDMIDFLLPNYEREARANWSLLSAAPAGCTAVSAWPKRCINTCGITASMYPSNTAIFRKTTLKKMRRGTKAKLGGTVMRFMKWLHPGLHIKRWLFLFGLGMMFSSFGIILTFNYQWLGEVEEWAFRLLYEMTGHYNYTILASLGIFVILVGMVIMGWATRRLIRTMMVSSCPVNREISAI